MSKKSAEVNSIIEAIILDCSSRNYTEPVDQEEDQKVRSMSTANIVIIVFNFLFLFLYFFKKCRKICQRSTPAPVNAMSQAEAKVLLEEFLLKLEERGIPFNNVS